MLVWLLTTALAAPFPLADAVALGDCEAVVAQLPPTSVTRHTRPAERLALAWCLRHDDPERVAALVAPLDADPWTSYGRLVLGEAQEAAGLPQAIDTLAGLDLPGAPGLRADLALGRALVRQGRSLEAREGLRALLDTEVGDEARYWLAVGGRDRGAISAAVATYQRVWIDAVTGPWGARAAQDLAALGRPIPDLTDEPGRAIVRERIVALQRAHQHADALELLDALRAAAGQTKPNLAYGRAQFEARQYADAVATWTAVLGEDLDSPAAAGVLFDLALATSRTGDYDGAARWYRVLLDKHPAHRQADEASFKLGYLPYDARDCDAAVPRFAEHLDRYPRSSQATSALWFSGWCLFTQARYDEALAWWGRLVETHPASELVPGARYWVARIAALSGDEAAARADLEALVHQHPDSAHAWLAARRLGVQTPSKRAVTRPPWPATWRKDPDVVAAEALLAAGFRTWAADGFAALRGRANSRETSLALAHALIAAGDGRSARRVASRYCEDEDPVAQQACLPRPERSIVESVAEAHGLHPWLPYAIMWTESLFDPSVTSGAGARGLMQVMPAEVDRLHSASAAPGMADGDRLYLAPYNALLGTTELALKADELVGLVSGTSLPAAIAAYNGGAGAVRRWVEQAGGAPVDADRFLEAIGYAETRRYTRTVLGRLAAYERVYGAPAP